MSVNSNIRDLNLSQPIACCWGAGTLKNLPKTLQNFTYNPPPTNLALHPPLQIEHRSRILSLGDEFEQGDVINGVNESAVWCACVRYSWPPPRSTSMSAVINNAWFGISMDVLVIRSSGKKLLRITTSISIVIDKHYLSLREIYSFNKRDYVYFYNHFRKNVLFSRIDNQLKIFAFICGWIWTLKSIVCCFRYYSTEPSIDKYTPYMHFLYSDMKCGYTKGIPITELL